MRLFRWVMLSTLVVGALLSLTQIAIDADHARKDIDRIADELLNIVIEPATQAIYSLDPDLANQVISGLFKKQSVRFAAITHPDGTILAQQSRPLLKTSTRWITDPIFKRERQYSVQLIKRAPIQTHYGNLTLSIDTAYAANAFLDRAWIIFISGMIRASVLGVILFFICHWLITRPLLQMIEQMLDIDPAQPGQRKLKISEKHHNDEFGAWVQTTNHFLEEIEHAQKRRQAAEARVLKLSQYDPLTGLPNRQLFQSLLKTALLDAEKVNQRVAVLCLGIDNFQAINDRYTYTTGDIVLKKYCERLCQDYGLPVVASRLGGDQFALFVCNVGSTYSTIKFVESLLDTLSAPYVIDDETIQVKTTIGVALFPDDERDAETLLQKAEQTMNFAKTQGQNHFRFYIANLDNELRERRELANDLSRALAQGDLFLVYQPQFHVRTQTIQGAEALLRWAHPTKGLIPPDVFIPIAEQEGLIKEIGAWVLDQVCRDLNAWKQWTPNLRVAVNLSPVQLKDPHFESKVSETLRAHAISPTNLEVEVTETAFMESIQDATAKLHAIRDMGIATAVDDFGTGYSSLSYLKQLPINTLKIDRQFIMDLTSTSEDACIVDAIVQMGHSLKMKVVAEGVETEEQFHYLQRCHCDLAQGYYFSKPLPEQEFVEFVRAWKEGTRQPSESQSMT